MTAMRNIGQLPAIQMRWIVSNSDSIWDHFAGCPLTAAKCEHCAQWPCARGDKHAHSISGLLLLAGPSSLRAVGQLICNVTKHIFRVLLTWWRFAAKPLINVSLFGHTINVHSVNYHECRFVAFSFIESLRANECCHCCQCYTVKANRWSTQGNPVRTSRQRVLSSLGPTRPHYITVAVVFDWEYVLNDNGDQFTFYFCI